MCDKLLSSKTILPCYQGFSATFLIIYLRFFCFQPFTFMDVSFGLWPLVQCGFQDFFLLWDFFPSCPCCHLGTLCFSVFWGIIPKALLHSRVILDLLHFLTYHLQVAFQKNKVLTFPKSNVLRHPECKVCLFTSLFLANNFSS